jgi:Na+/H+-dicarboxylate symporter
LETGNQIDPRVTRLMLPLGTTINMDGTALWQVCACLHALQPPAQQAIAVVFIAQMEGVELDFRDMIVIGATAVLASMAATSMPSAGLVTIGMVLSAIGMNTDGITILLPVVRWKLCT